MLCFRKIRYKVLERGMKRWLWFRKGMLFIGKVVDKRKVEGLNYRGSKKVRLGWFLFVKFGVGL